MKKDKCENNHNYELFNFIRKFPAYRYLKEPVDTERQLYERYPDGLEGGAFVYAIKENCFYSWNFEEKKWIPIITGQVEGESVIEDDLNKHKEDSSVHFISLDCEPDYDNLSDGAYFINFNSGIGQSAVHVTEFLFQTSDVYSSGKGNVTIQIIFRNGIGYREKKDNVWSDLVSITGGTTVENNLGTSTTSAISQYITTYYIQSLQQKISSLQDELDTRPIGIEDAPADNNMYVRYNNMWVLIEFSPAPSGKGFSNGFSSGFAAMEPSVSFLNVSPKTLSMPSVASSEQITVESDTDWEVE